jgi:hypothetical protein
MNAKHLATPISAAWGDEVMKFRNLLSLSSHFKDEPEEGSEMWVTNGSQFM